MDLPKLIASKLLIQANSGGGKSWLIRRLVEQAYGKVQIIIIDPEGEFSTLREKFDFVLAGKGGDTPADPKSAALLARKLLELEVSAIIDLYELPPQERKRFVRLFLESMVNAPKELYHDALVVLDEAHMFVPEKDESEAASAVIDLASRGRKRGFCAVLATQRISKLAKDAAAECNNKLIGRTSLDIDRKRAADELGITSKEETLALRTLNPGEFFAFGPAISSEVIKIQVGDVQTSVPKAGAKMRVVPPTSRIKKMLGKLADLPQEAKEEAETIVTLKARVRELERQPVVKAESKRIEVPVLKDKQITRLESVFMKMTHEAERHGSAMSLLWGNFDEVGKSMLGALEAIRDFNRAPTALVAPLLPRPVIHKEQHSAVRVSTDNNDAAISSSQQKILDSLSWLETIGIQKANKNQLALLSDASPTSGGYFNNLGSLRSRGYIAYPASSEVCLTATGRDAAEVFDSIRSNDDLHSKIKGKLSSSQWAILQHLISIYPNDISKTELAEATGQSPTSGGYFNNLGSMRSLKLLDYPSSGRVKATEILFPL